MERVILGDNLKVLEGMQDSTIDLCYLDPPFYTGKDFKQNGEVQFTDKFKDLKTYIQFMKFRFVQIHRLLSETGSLYLHIDPRTSHYLKIELDKIFGIQNFMNEIVWCYSGGGYSKRCFPQKHDVILVYFKSRKYIFKLVDYKPYGRGARQRHGSSVKLRGYKYDLTRGTPISDWWTDIPRLHNWSNERRKDSDNYPTQKPVKLLERIIKSSSNEGDTVLDPFCGSGTTCVAAKILNRQFIGIDSNENAVEIARSRIDRLKGLF